MLCETNHLLIIPFVIISILEIIVHQLVIAFIWYITVQYCTILLHQVKNLRSINDSEAEEFRIRLSDYGKCIKFLDTVIIDTFQPIISINKKLRRSE